MAREINISGMIAIGNGEPCPFCVTEDNRLTDNVFVMEAGKNFMEHMISEHPSELNKALFKDPPPKLWLEEDFQLVVAKIGSILRRLDEDEIIPHEEFEDSMQNIYGIMKDYFNES